MSNDSNLKLQSDWLLKNGVWLIPWTVLTFLWGLGSVPLFDLDEGAFSVATWEMLQRQDFITTYLNGELRFDKPILIYWFQALSVSLFGINEWGFRFPSAVFAILWVLIVYRFAKERINSNTATYSAALLCSSFMVIVIGRAATADALLNLLLTLTLFDIYRYFASGERQHIYRTYLWMALGFLCKGPVAIVIPLAVSFTYSWLQKRWRDWLRALFFFPGWFLFIAIALPWYTAILIEQGQAFIDGFVLKHNVGRFSSTMEGHGGQIWYYAAAIFIVLLPYGGWFISSISNIRQSLSTPLNRFLWIWFGFVFVFFSFSSTQLPHYLLYGLPPLMILLAGDSENLKNTTLTWLPALVLPVLTLLLPFAGQWIHESDAYLQAMFRDSSALFNAWYWVGTGALWSSMIALIFAYPSVRLSSRLLTFGLLQCIYLLLILFPVASGLQQAPVQQAGLYLKNMTPQPDVFMKGVNMPSITIYRQQITPKLQRELQAGEWVFTKKGKFPEENFHIRFDQGGIQLLEKK